MELPYGFGYGEKGQYMKLNLHGLADASYNWFQKLSEGLVKSEVDQCVFIRIDCVILVYVDDMIALANNNKVLNDLVTKLKIGITFYEGSLNKYLGVDVKAKPNSSFELPQTFLI